jgi:putative two-component system hydrogenase maturation factor HypX/HoxX
VESKRASRAADERRRPLESYRAEELALMRLDIFDDRRGFAAARHAFRHQADQISRAGHPVDVESGSSAKPGGCKGAR